MARRPGPKKRPRGTSQNLAEIRSLDAELSTGAPPRGRPKRSATAADGANQSMGGTGGLEYAQVRALSCAVTAELDFGRLARAILAQARSVLGADRGILFLGRADAAGVVPVLAEGVHGEELRELQSVSRTILSRSREGEIVISENAPADPRFAQVSTIKNGQMRSILAGPLVVGTETIGVLYLDAIRAHAFVDRAVELFRVLTGVAAVAFENARVHSDLLWENASLRAHVLSAGVTSLARMAGYNARMREILRQAEAAARLDAPLLIVGESGCGRRRLARAIHDSGRRASAPFVACDILAVPPAHLRGVLLGRTGPAAKARPVPEAGLVRQAEPGTLCVAEAQGLGDDLGAEIVALAEDLSFRVMGSRHDEHANVRVILTAEPRFLERRGRRRAGLARIVHWLALSLPPLRERPEDIPVIVEQLLRCSVDPTGRAGTIPSFSREAIDLLQRQPWPGNVRELEYVVHRLLLSAPRQPISVELAKAALDEQQKPREQPIGPWSGQLRPLREWHDEAIRRALHETGGNQSAAAKLLGVHRNTVLKWVKSS